MSKAEDRLNNKKWKTSKAEDKLNDRNWETSKAEDIEMCPLPKSCAAKSTSVTPSNSSVDSNQTTGIFQVLIPSICNELIKE